MNTILNRYEIFLKVVELGNITRASEALNYTQSGISHAIAALEKETGFSLFVRSSNGVTLTENGKQILDPIQTLVNQQRNLTQSIFNINNVIAGTIRIGTFTSVCAQWLPTIIQTFQKLHPLVEFELFSGNHDEITSWIMHGKADCGFLAAPVSEPLFFLPLKRDPMLALLPANHPLTKQNAVPLRELLNEPFILPVKGADNDIRQLLSTLPKSAVTKYALNDALSVLSMVEHGFGVSILPELVLRNYMFNIGIRPLDPPQYRTIGIASLSVKQLSVVTKTFLNFLSDTNLVNFEAM